MDELLRSVVAKLAAHAGELRRRGIAHAAVFGSTARGEARPDSDVDILVDLDFTVPITLFDYVRIEDDLREIVGRPVDLADRSMLKPLLRDEIIAEAVHAF
jgi:predicted nucleotidyltransferase